MAKSKTVYVCQNCGVDSPKWIGKCPSCGEWNTYVEEIVTKTAPNIHDGFVTADSKPMLISEIRAEDAPRIHTGSNELNNVLGGGLVPGSMVLIGGEPGIGKSTLVLQVAMNIPDKRVLYISGEESVQQIKLRAERLAGNASDCYIVSETSLEKAITHARNIQPDILIIDSIQTLSTERVESSPGSVSQVRECAALLLRYCKENGLPVFLVGHINKEGSLAGPKVLEHIVDTVLQFEGDRNHMYRILRSVKNRFGSTSELGIYEMQQSGLREVENPSEFLLMKEHAGLSGIAIAAAIEGVRPLLIEVQGLVSTAAYGVPQRSATGFDTRRLNMLLAVMEKRIGFKIATKDVFINIAGGLKVVDPAIDLAIMASIISSNIDAVIPLEVCFTGEVGLSGEIRPVGRIEQRINEAEKLGFKKIVIPKGNLKNARNLQATIEIVESGRVDEAFRKIINPGK
jgi:DNA repair protein RadA/Sms